MLSTFGRKRGREKSARGVCNALQTLRPPITLLNHKNNVIVENGDVFYDVIKYKYPEYFF